MELTLGSLSTGRERRCAADARSPGWYIHNITQRSRTRYYASFLALYVIHAAHPYVRNAQEGGGFSPPDQQNFVGTSRVKSPQKPRESAWRRAQQQEHQQQQRSRSQMSEYQQEVRCHRRRC